MSATKSYSFWGKKIELQYIPIQKTSCLHLKKPTFNLFIASSSFNARNSSSTPR